MDGEKERLTALEELTAHQAVELETLSDVVRSQGQEIERLRVALLRLRDRMTTLEEAGPSAHEDVPPPHY